MLKHHLLFQGNLFQISILVLFCKRSQLKEIAIFFFCLEKNNPSNFILLMLFTYSEIHIYANMMKRSQREIECVPLNEFHNISCTSHASEWGRCDIQKAEKLLKSSNSSEGKIFHEISFHLCFVSQRRCRGAELLSNYEWRSLIQWGRKPWWAEYKPQWTRVKLRLPPSST